MTFAQALALTSVGSPQETTVINILEPLGGDSTVPAATVAEMLPSEFEEQVVNTFIAVRVDYTTGELVEEAPVLILRAKVRQAYKL